MKHITFLMTWAVFALLAGAAGAQSGGWLVAWGPPLWGFYSWTNAATHRPRPIINELPPAIRSMSNLVAVAAGPRSGAVLDLEGRAFFWGFVRENKTLVSATDRSFGRVTAFAVGGEHWLAVNDAGLVTNIHPHPRGPARLQASSITNAAAVYAGWGNTMVVDRDGSVHNLGWPSRASLSNVQALALTPMSWAGRNLALTKDGRVWVWNRQNPRIESLEMDGTPIAVAAGPGHQVVLRSDGRLHVAGSGFYGETTPPQGLTNIVGVSAGGVPGDIRPWGFTLALTADGDVISWGRMGRNVNAEAPFDLDGVISIAAGDTVAYAITTNASRLAPFR